MNRKAFSKISIIFYAIVFVIIWALVLADQLNTWGAVAIANGGYSGIEALFYQNLNLVVAVIFFISLLALGAVSE